MLWKLWDAKKEIDTHKFWKEKFLSRIIKYQRSSKQKTTKTKNKAAFGLMPKLKTLWDNLYQILRFCSLALTTRINTLVYGVLYVNNTYSIYIWIESWWPKFVEKWIRKKHASVYSTPTVFKMPFLLICW